jgi:S1-C subfamily serine protease
MMICRIAGWLAGAALLAGCAAAPVPDLAAHDAAIRAEAAATASAAAWATVTASAPLSASAGTPAPPLGAAAVFQRVAPSVAYVDVPGGTGSGVLTPAGYVVTNAHVVWPYDRARVVFAGGAEFPDVPVHNVDLLADLALLGPLDLARGAGAGLTPATFAAGEGLGVGAEVYLIGFPGEGERFPQPAIARGIISRMREWDALGITYFQSDAAVAGGQSGGMLVSAAGDVIGISGFSLAEGNFALAASAADLQPRIERLAAGEDVDGLPAPSLTGEGSRLGARFAPAHYYDQRMYLLQGRPGDEVSVRAEGDLDLFLAVTDIYGEYAVLADEGQDGSEAGAFAADVDAPYFVIAGPMEDPQPNDEIALRASQRLRAFEDADDGRPVRAGETVTAQIDYPGDSDIFRLDLRAGNTVRVRVDSLLMDPYLTVDFADAGPDDRVHDDDRGGGMFGMNAEVVYTAPRDAEYWLVIEDSYGAETGGYLLTVEPM